MRCESVYYGEQIVRILCTGASGKIGKEVVKLFQEHELLLVDKKGENSVKCNLAFDDLEFIKEFKPEAIIHLAASFERTDETPMFHRINYQDNILASYRLNKLISEFEYCPKAYIFASSYLVYDSSLYLAPYPLRDVRHLSEVDELMPRNLIGASKLYTEGEIDFIQRNIHKSMKVCHARIFRVYGEEGQDFVSRLVEWKKEGLPVQIWKPENRFDYISSHDCAGAIKALLEKAQTGVYNVGYGVSTSIQQILDVINPKIQKITQNDLYESSCADTDKIEEETGWTPKVNVLDWCKEKLCI